MYLLRFNKSIFYAHDCRTRRWLDKNEKVVLQPKGEGHSLMVANFVSADYSWCEDKEGSSAEVYFQPWKNHKGYFDGEKI